MNKAEPHFRAVTCNGVRRGMRLEQIYWDALDQLAKRQDSSVGDVIAEIYDNRGEEGSLSSAVRSYVASELLTLLDIATQRIADLSTTPIIRACPTPAFILSQDKRIINYNGAFISFLQLRFAGFESTDAMKKIALVLDTSMEDLFVKLSEKSTKVTKSGFAIGVAGHRVRGTLNLTLIPNETQISTAAPAKMSNAALAFIVE